MKYSTPHIICDCCCSVWPKRFITKIGKGFQRLRLCAICADEMIKGAGTQYPLELRNWLVVVNDWLSSEEGSVYVLRNMATIGKLSTRKQEEIPMITTEVRTSFVNVFQARLTPSGDRKTYSVCALIEKTDEKGLARIDEAIRDAVAKGVEKGIFPATAIPALKRPLHDGDEKVATGERGPEFKGKFFLNCSRAETNGAPGVVKRENGEIVDIIDPQEYYSGCYSILDINFFPYNKKGNKGIGVGLNNCLKTRDGDRLDGRMDAHDAFADYADLPNVPQTEGGDPVPDAERPF